MSGMTGKKKAGWLCGAFLGVALSAGTAQAQEYAAPTYRAPPPGSYTYAQPQQPVFEERRGEGFPWSIVFNMAVLGGMFYGWSRYRRFQRESKLPPEEQEKLKAQRGLLWKVIRQKMGGGDTPATASSHVGKQIAVDKKKSDKTFKDVAGIDEAIEEVRDIVEFLKNPDKFRKLGAKIPKGILMEGPPGNGKTLLAKAAAGEAGVPFFSVSGSDFVRIFVGTGADNVRTLFAEARKNAPCIVFIDEIDAIGKKRGGLNSHEERENTLNQILVEMDGFDETTNIIVMAATNRVDTLDSALTRPGRFDRKVAVGKPDEKGRKAIIEVYLEKIKTEGPLDTQALAAAALGFSGAQIANFVNEAALAAAKADKEGVTQYDLVNALEDEALGGREDRSKIVSEKTKERTAFHEAGHAVMMLHGGQRRIMKATVVPRKNSHGHVWSVPLDDDVTWASLEKDIEAMLGGRVAEEIKYGDKKNVGPGAGGGPGSDINQATKLTRHMVAQLGMSELGPVDYADDPETGSSVAETTATLLDEAVKGEIMEAYKNTETCLKTHWNEVKRVAKALEEHGTLTGDDIADAAAGRPLTRFSPPGNSPAPGLN